MHCPKPLILVLLAASFACASSARAHICMDAPMSRVGPSCNINSAQKPGPCGINTRSTKYVTEFKPGEVITVSLNETVNHDSHYRIAFNPSGATFEDPTSKDDKSGNHPFVLLDGIMDESAAKQSIKVTLPNVTCDNCTLQLIQVMYDKGGNGFGNDDIYYACADIVLKGTPAAGGDAGSSDILPPDGLPRGDAGGPTRPIGDAGAASDASASGGDGGGSSPPAPRADAGAGTGTAGGSADASTAGGSGDASTAGGDGGTGGGTGEEDEDDGGCSLAWGRSRSHALVALFGLSALAVLLRLRRRRTR